MAADPHLQDVALLIEKGFTLKDLWGTLPWDDEMPEEYIEAFAEIYRMIDHARVQKFSGV
jgi:hypothetical protein